MPSTISSSNGLDSVDPKDFFLHKFSNAVGTFPEKTETSPAQTKDGYNIVYRDDVLSALAQHDEVGMAPADRKTRFQYHPDRQGPDSKHKPERARELLEKYEQGRTTYLRTTPFKSLEEMIKNNLDPKQTQGMPTMFHYDLQDENGNQIPYNSSMGDIFFHPYNDVLSKHKHRQVPAELKDDSTAAGAIHAYFKDFFIHDPKIRSSIISIFLNASETDRQALRGFLPYARTALKKYPDIRTARELEIKCRVIEDAEYKRSLGMNVSLHTTAAAQRLAEFQETASVIDVYQLRNYIATACELHVNEPMERIIAKAHEARLADSQLPENRTWYA